MTKQTIVKLKQGFRNKRPANVVLFKVAPRERREKFYYEKEGIYDPNFKRESTPSIERAVNYD